MPSTDDLQSLLAKYRVAPQIQATLDSALARANDKVDQQPVHTNITEIVTTPKSAELQLSTRYSGSSAPRTLDSSPEATRLNEGSAIRPRTMKVDIPVKKEEGHRSKEAVDQKGQQALPMELAKGQTSVEKTEKNVKISETIEHYKQEPPRHLGAHSVGTQTPLVLTEENETLRRLQGELDHVKSQLSCLQAEVIKQFFNLNSKLTAFLSQHKQ
ncbi:Hypothetical protein GLP15_2553 [Giardia lamblia P15]|uniref:Uncharacterized protein n=1 Tax=Giardia intestinalis (strain P15) TaxID=658858 RepID=E1EXM2_GIAIA|nr:Hypothetical protein GLP15_2553 [Giardia lamblia P15]